jgi:DNA-directed RNA polymerase subunit RPC12/RpoP
MKECKHEVTSKLDSIKKLKCMNCGKEMDWVKEDKPLVSSNRDKRPK